MNFLPWNMIDPAKYEDSAYPVFFNKIIAGRGFSNHDIASTSVQLMESVHNPMTLPDMEPAVLRIQTAIQNSEKILVYGDYDCDGITSTVMLYDYLENEGADVTYYIPERDGEGYGLNMSALEQINDAEIKLIITVDNGISAVKEVEQATAYGIDVIITDHHQPSETLPNCIAVINPHRTDSSYPYKYLCGAGVVFKLLTALDNDTDGILFEQYGDLLAIATMADIVPLDGENKAFVKLGIKSIQTTERMGIVALAEVAGIDHTTITSEQISFGLAPRINAAGRIGSVDAAVELLLCKDMEESQNLAKSVNDLNVRRKDIEAAISADIDDMVAKNPFYLQSRVFIIDGRSWHHGVIGITAARMVEKYRKPCIIFSTTSSGELRGSGRSIEGYSLIEAIRACDDVLLKYGGHPMAAGLSLTLENLPAFRQQMEQYSQEHYPIMPTMRLTVDATIDTKELTVPNIKLLEKLEPFGCKNPKPLVALMGVPITAISPIGGGKHMRLRVGTGNATTDLVYFGMRQENFPLTIGSVVDCAISPSINVYQDVERVSARVVSMVPTGYPMDNKLLGSLQHGLFKRGEPLDPAFIQSNQFSRAELSKVFVVIRGKSPYTLGVDNMLHTLGAEYGYFRILIAMDILQELKLIQKTIVDGVTIYTLLPATGKADIASADTYQKLTAYHMAE